jgi:Flp pilus assembly protein TadG
MIRLRRRDRQRGQALVEFALVIPIFLLVIFGLVDLGRAVFVNNTIAEAARDGARYGSVQARSYNDASRATVEDWVLDRLAGEVPNPTVTVTCIPQTTALGCTGNGDDFVIVTVETDLDMITPIIGQIVGTLELDARSEVLVNN